MVVVLVMGGVPFTTAGAEFLSPSLLGEVSSVKGLRSRQSHQSLSFERVVLGVAGWGGSTAQYTYLKKTIAVQKFGASFLEIAFRVWGVFFGISSSMANFSLFGWL